MINIKAENDLNQLNLYGRTLHLNKKNQRYEIQ